MHFLNFLTCKETLYTECFRFYYKSKIITFFQNWINSREICFSECQIGKTLLKKLYSTEILYISLSNWNNYVFLKWLIKLLHWIWRVTSHESKRLPKKGWRQISCLVCVEYQTLKMIICHFLKATREYSHHARLMSEPPGIISVLRFRPPRSVAAAPPLLFGHLLLRKWDSFEKSEGCWYQSCYVTVWPVCCYCLDHSNTL